jgi:hypothetical protein
MNRLACAPITVQRLENKNNEYSGSDVNQVDLNRLDANAYGETHEQKATQRDHSALTFK